jgi:ABC-type nitrate/sulfonate/bicarbonate transport system permease component
MIRRSGVVAHAGFGVRQRTLASPRSVIVGAVLTLFAWEAIAQVVRQSAAHPEQVFPSLTYVFGPATRALSHYWQGGLGVAPPARGGSETYLAAGLALVDNGAASLLRVGLGFALALVAGVGLGLAVGWSRKLRLLTIGVADLLRLLPLLAMVPLFSLWFGATTLQAVLFIGFAVGVILLVTTINAIENVPSYYKEYAATLGASQLQVYRTVIAPAILPELKGPLLVSAGFAWSVSLASELLGIQSGLGWMMSQALRFNQTGRMVVIALVFVLLAILSFKLIERLAGRVTRWDS